MKAFAVLALLFCPLAYSSECPLVSNGETAEDCPWAGIAREWAKTGSKLETLAPELERAVRSDREHPALLSAWGQTLNFDEAIREEIVPDGLLRTLTEWIGVPAPVVARPGVNRVHSGVEHIYGYLFSTKNTPYGFKRARWVKDEIEVGFHLPRGALGPTPAEATLFRNITVFLVQWLKRAGLAQDLKVQTSVASTAVAQYAPRKPIELILLQERKGDQTVTTLFVPFEERAPGRKNTHLLIYSAYEPSVGTRLYTAFPVEESFVERAIAPAGLGSGQKLAPRYNAWMPEFAGNGIRQVLKKQISPRP
jgi:hypothetical protein